MKIELLKAEMHIHASKAATDYLQEHFDGQDAGACGFAWVVLVPQHRGNSSKGKTERKAFEGLGGRKSYTGNTWEIWNPSNTFAQNVDCKEAGAEAAVKYLRGHGFKAYAGSRLD